MTNEEILNAISEMSVLELSELVKQSKKNSAYPQQHR